MARKPSVKNDTLKTIAPTWSHIQKQAEQFVLKYRNSTREQADSKVFIRDFLVDLYGIDPIQAGNYERQVGKLGNKYGFIDYFLPGKLVIEFKSAGKDLDLALLQALDYHQGLAQEERPRYILTCDFAHFHLHDLLDKANDLEFSLEDLPKYVKAFGFLIDHESEYAEPEKLVDIRAAELMGSLHDELKESGYGGHDLEVLLVRLLFCLFADDTGIFEFHAFQTLIQKRTHPDGSNLFSELAAFFDTLNKPENKRLKNLPDYLAGFPYINGKLFEETISTVYANAKIRDILLSCSGEDWSAISPAIFGSLFQTVMEEDQDGKRRNLGAHYTSENNILKLIRPLFLDELYAGLEACGSNRAKLEKFHDRLASLRFLDPACGCGNFLIIAYRELRRLEMKVLDLLYPKNRQGHRQLVLDIGPIIKVNVDQFYGIELEEFPAQVAQVAMWLMDHLMNREVSSLFGRTFTRLPLVKSAAIQHGNALTLEWPKVDCILGNPPFVGAKYMDASQKKDVSLVFKGIKNSGLLDYVAAWYVKAARGMKKTPVKCAFVSTNSICQGEQVGVLWSWMLDQGMKIFFVHRTFQWSNEARGKAAVHCVIVGFTHGDLPSKQIFEYENIKGEPESIQVKNINPYLVDAPDVVVQNRKNPLCPVPQIGIGNKPIDGGHYLFTEEEKASFLAVEPKAAPYFRRWLGAHEFLNGYHRYCLWLGDCPPKELRKMPECLKRIEAVRELRKNSKSKPTQKLAETPTRFHVENMPDGEYLIIPEVSSERRFYIPIGFEMSDTLASNKLRLLPNASLYEFGIIHSCMHMAWVRAVTGRLKSDFQYSIKVVYNNFPWPESPTEKQKQTVSTASQKVLDARKTFPDSTLADLYDPLTMPSVLSKAHQALDKAVDACYGVKNFPNEAKRVAFLFSLYDHYLQKEALSSETGGKQE
ncbi:DNA methyltransferase [Desulfobotulus mexicanus]|uniref:DNA methyltransferase n=1 Tax=Desulfobotulus mexicanus TaxID=2586642 RepID=UPI001C558E37|nr:DNA methyltransferase [Desulfobotulus mexicanus]